MKVKMTKNFENIKVKLTIKEAEELYLEVSDGINDSNHYAFRQLNELLKILEKTKPITNNDTIKKI